MRRKILTIGIVSLMFITTYAENRLEVKVSGIENLQGSLYIALFNSKDTFLGKSSEGEIIKVEASTAEIVFTDLRDDKYAIAIFQDENLNGKLDLGKFGIPSEKYGFSNNINPAELRRSPTFEECMFGITEDSSISINLISATSK